MKKIILLGVLTFIATAYLFAAPSYWKGTGGKGMSIAVLLPEGKGLSAEQRDYLPILMQGVFMTTISKYSAISVLNRQTLEKLLHNTENKIYKTAADFVELGKITKTGNILSSSVTKTSNAYSFAVTIADAKTGDAKAAYSGTCTVQEFDNFSGIKKIVLELLTQMGVELTDKAKVELGKASDVKQIKAQIALAQGITAQKTGNSAASLAYYYTANQYDPALKEAGARVKNVSSIIYTGSMGDNVRNDIAWRNEWQNLLKEAKNYLENNLDPLIEFRYTTNLKQESIDYNAGTVNLSVETEWTVIEQPPTLKMLKDLDDGLKATKRDKDWGMSPGGTSGFFIKELKIYFDRYYEIKADLYNDNGVLIGSTIIATKPDGKEELPFWSKFTNAPTYDFITDSVGYKIRLLKKKYRSWMNPFDFNIRKEWYEEVFYAKEKSKLVFTVKADSITDKMIIKIANINEYVASMDPEGPFIKKKSLLVVELILFLPTPLRNKFFAWRNAAWRP